MHKGTKSQNTKLKTMTKPRGQNVSNAEKDLIYRWKSIKQNKKKKERKCGSEKKTMIVIIALT